ncbi:MAG: hypothetical protein EOO38_09850 [Cytophagaceae bacterium]|nr:MAG: hypothetical protein EOO38_09850 [Cytophagaceae bacterium]
MSERVTGPGEGDDGFWVNFERRYTSWCPVRMNNVAISLTDFTPNLVTVYDYLDDDGFEGRYYVDYSFSDMKGNLTIWCENYLAGMALKITKG